MKVLKTHKSFDGSVRFWEHHSKSTGTKMKFSTFTPEWPIKGALIWLSGLTCTEENFITKAGAQKYLAQAQLMVICPDTSPRGLNLPGEHDAYDFGSGAGFYINALTAGYREHYKMYDYVALEIYDLLQTEFHMKDNISIFGHSMGGHGALTIGLKEKGKFKSISAFSPIVNPASVPWGQKAFTGFLGEERKIWHEYDACELVREGFAHPQPLLIDQGTHDEFLEVQLRTKNLEDACGGTSQKLNVRMREGYDHSYYFIASFIEEHIAFHAGHFS
jgi:S-formylglutathione hydrolase